MNEGCSVIAAYIDHIEGMLYVANLRNIEDLIKLKPKDRTLVFWDFDDTMFIVHKNSADRLWGDSSITSFMKSMHYRFCLLF